MQSAWIDPQTLTKPPKTKLYLSIFLFVFLILGSFMFAGFSFLEILQNLRYSGRLIGKMFFPPAWDYADNIIKPLLETIQMAILGSFVGAILAFPVAFGAASVFTKSKWIHGPTRFILNIVRTIPALVLASLFVAVFGIGNFAGTLALSIFSFGLVSKMLYESIEAIDLGPIEAIVSSGGNQLEILKYAILPQVLPQYLSYTLYAFEVNVRAAAVLGYVGAGGIGQVYERALAWRQFDRVGMIVLISFVAVLLIDMMSSSIRRRLV
jgi:phosphonate transport system permease protein